MSISERKKSPRRTPKRTPNRTPKRTPKRTPERTPNRQVEFKPKDYVCTMNGKNLKADLSLRLVSPGKIRVYVSYPNGRVYSTVSSRSKNIRFNPSRFEWVYTWSGEYDIEPYSTRYRTIQFKFRFHSSKSFKQVQELFT